jgi:hypothetical protein
LAGAEWGNWQCSASIGHAVCMPKTPKVVPIHEHQSSIIARDEKTQRIILGIGSERIAIDFTRRITKLPPHTGDEPAVVPPMKQNKKKQKPR